VLKNSNLFFKRFNFYYLWLLKLRYFPIFRLVALKEENEKNRIFA